jgi:HSP20 family protein
MANMSRFDPFSDMVTLREAMNNLFEESFVRPSGERGGTLSMPVDLSETKDSFFVEATLPGVKPEDLDITLQDSVLTITGEVRQEHSAGEKPNYHRVERRYGRMARAISLPTQVQADKISAHLEHGVLRLEIPKAEAVKPRKISVNGHSQGNETKQLEVGQKK